MTLLKLGILTSVLSILAHSAAASVVITNFHSSAASDPSSPMVGHWSYDSTTSTLAGTEGAGDSLFGDSENMDLGSPTALSLTANATAAPGGLNGFTITLEDINGKFATADFLWSSFSGGATVDQSLDIEPNFDFSHQVQWNIASGGSGEAIDIMFSSLVAIPEPGSLALVATGLIFAWRARARRYAGRRFPQRQRLLGEPTGNQSGPNRPAFLRRPAFSAGTADFCLQSASPASTTT